MPPEMNWLNIEIDQVKAICMFDASKDEELKETLNWKMLHSHYQKIYFLRKVSDSIS